jgi:hypothetical protein
MCRARTFPVFYRLVYSERSLNKELYCCTRVLFRVTYNTFFRNINFENSKILCHSWCVGVTSRKECFLHFSILAYFS